MFFFSLFTPSSLLLSLTSFSNMRTTSFFVSPCFLFLSSTFPLLSQSVSVSHCNLFFLTCCVHNTEEYFQQKTVFPQIDFYHNNKDWHSCGRQGVDPKGDSTGGLGSLKGSLLVDLFLTGMAGLNHVNKQNQRTAGHPQNTFFRQAKGEQITHKGGYSGRESFIVYLRSAQNTHMHAPDL